MSVGCFCVFLELVQLFTRQLYSSYPFKSTGGFQGIWRTQLPCTLPQSHQRKTVELDLILEVWCSSLNVDPLQLTKALFHVESSLSFFKVHRKCFQKTIQKIFQKFLRKMSLVQKCPLEFLHGFFKKLQRNHTVFFFRNCLQNFSRYFKLNATKHRT